MRAIFHIGVPKTGTTTLQNSLHAARGTLAARGILYPSLAALGHLNHHPLILGILPPEKLPRQFRYKPEAWRGRLSKAAVDSVARDIRAEAPQHLLLSSEYFSRGFTPTELDRVAALLDGFGVSELVFSVYVRRPSAHYLSLLTQSLRHSGTIRPVEPFRIRPRLEALRGAFPSATVVPGVFEREALTGQDIVADFTARFLTPLGVGASDVPTRGQANVSVSGESTGILMAFRRSAFPGRDNRPARASISLFDTLAAIEARLGPRRPRLRPEIAAYLDAASDDPAWLEQAHGLVFPGLDAASRPGSRPPVAQSLADIIEIDGDYQALLLHELARSSWALLPWRQVWVRSLAAGRTPRRLLPWL